MPNESLVDFAKPQTKQSEDASVDATIVILAEVLCVFAARGRALREERAKRNMPQLDAPTVKGEHDDANL